MIVCPGVTSLLFVSSGRFSLQSELIEGFQDVPKYSFLNFGHVIILTEFMGVRVLFRVGVSYYDNLQKLSLELVRFHW